MVLHFGSFTCYYEAASKNWLQMQWKDLQEKKKRIINKKAKKKPDELILCTQVHQGKDVSYFVHGHNFKVSI